LRLPVARAAVPLPPRCPPEILLHLDAGLDSEDECALRRVDYDRWTALMSPAFWRYMVRLLDDLHHRNRIADRAASDMATRYDDEAVGAASRQRLVVLARARERGASDPGECIGRIPVERRGQVHEPDVA